MQCSHLRQLLPGAIVLVILAVSLGGDVSDNGFVDQGAKAIPPKLLPAHERPQRPVLANASNFAASLA